jgi:hypothetical protein
VQRAYAIKNTNDEMITGPPAIEEEDILQEPKGMLILQNKNLHLGGYHDDARYFNAHVKDDIVLSTSHATSASIAGNHLYCDIFNQSSQIVSFKAQNCYRIAKSAETYFLAAHPFAHIHTRPKALTNPFAPASIRIPMVPGRRRWAHTFPIGMTLF